MKQKFKVLNTKSLELGQWRFSNTESKNNTVSCCYVAADSRLFISPLQLSFDQKEALLLSVKHSAE